MLLGGGVLSGDAGDDTLDGNGGPIGTQALYISGLVGITADLTAGTASDGLGGTDMLFDIETLSGTNFDDSLTGAIADERFFGADGDDTIAGLGGNDFLFPGLGDDLVDGGAGVNDSVGYNFQTAAIEIDLEAGTARDGSGGMDTIMNVEDIDGSMFNDVIFGSNGPNFIRGREGTDILMGQDGDDNINGDINNTPDTENDTAVYKDFIANYSITILPGTVDVVDNVGTEGNDSLINVEFLQFADEIFSPVLAELPGGGGGNDTLNGTAGTDLINGRASADFLDGLGGDDVIHGGDNDDVVRGGAGDDTLVGGNGDDLLLGGQGVDFLTGAAGADDFFYESLLDIGVANDGQVGLRSSDRIIDWQPGVDKLVFEQAAFGGIAGPLVDGVSFFTVSDFDGTNALGVLPGVEYFVFDPNSNTVYYDNDSSQNGYQVGPTVQAGTNVVADDIEIFAP